MRKWLTMLACALVLLVDVAASSTPADARRGGGGARAHGGHARGHAGHMHRNFAAGRGVHRHVNVNRSLNRTVGRQYAYRNGRRGFWRNGVWVAAPLVAGGAVAATTCAYEYGRWQATGSTYWRDRYNQCTN